MATKQRNTIKKRLQQFYTYLEKDRELSDATITNYQFYLERFCTWGSIQSVSNITKQKITQYKQWMSKKTKEHPELDESTQNYHLIAIRVFLTYLFEEGVETLEPEEITLYDIEPEDTQTLTDQELTRLLEAPLKSDEPDIIKLRDKAILELFHATGMKVSELAMLQVKQYDTQTSTITLGSKSKERMMRLTNTAKHALNNYLKKRPTKSRFVFTRYDRASASQPTSCLTPRSIQRLLKRYAKDAGITKKTTPQTMRHSYAKNRLAAGENLKQLQSQLGYAAISTTQRYLN